MYITISCGPRSVMMVPFDTLHTGSSLLLHSEISFIGIAVRNIKWTHVELFVKPLSLMMESGRSLNIQYCKIMS